ncbi:MAG TPA: hypothetical protein VKT30_18965 [Caulobacteraceae bacterium]|nr:hypothetical protein [Caulobacteraceae bacterium]
MLLRSLPMLLISSVIFAVAVWLVTSGEGSRATFIDPAVREAAAAPVGASATSGARIHALNS